MTERRQAGDEPLQADLARYCRELEAYLCQKNSGHLIRIVGPAFEQVCSWAERGVPLKIALRGIDRYCERDSMKRGRRRPVRIEFCEADILDAFDDWRRAVGVSPPDGDASAHAAEGAARRTPLAPHIERALARLRQVIASGDRSHSFAALAASISDELESFLASARGARGEARARIVERLSALDADLAAALLQELPPAVEAELKREAEAELAPFGSRIPPDARARALAAAFERLARESIGLPTLRYG